MSGFPLKGHKRLRKNNQPKQREEHKAPPHSASLALVFFLFSSFPKLVLYTRFHTLTFPPLQCVTNQLDSYRKMSCKQWRHRRHQNQDCATVSTDGSTAVGAEVFLHDSKPTRANYDATTKHKNSFFRRRGSTLHEEKMQKSLFVKACSDERARKATKEKHSPPPPSVGRARSRLEPSALPGARQKCGATEEDQHKIEYRERCGEGEKQRERQQKAMTMTAWCKRKTICNLRPRGSSP